MQQIPNPSRQGMLTPIGRRFLQHPRSETAAVSPRRLISRVSGRHSGHARRDRCIPAALRPGGADTRQPPGRRWLRCGAGRSAVTGLLFARVSAPSPRESLLHCPMDPPSLFAWGPPARDRRDLIMVRPGHRTAGASLRSSKPIPFADRRWCLYRDTGAGPQV
jgi:hypothetical protein